MPCTGEHGLQVEVWLSVKNSTQTILGTWQLCIWLDKFTIV